MQKSDQPELSNGKAEAGAVEPMPNRRDHDRHEQQIEKPETRLAFAANDRPKGNADNDEIESALRGERKQFAQGNVSLPESEPQQERCHHRNANYIADQQRRKNLHNISNVELPDRE